MIIFNVNRLAKPIFIIILMMTLSMILFLQMYKDNIVYQADEVTEPSNLIEEHNVFQHFRIEDNSNGRWRNLTKKQNSDLSILGKIMYLDAPYPENVPRRTYKILLWKYGHTTDSRHFKRFTNRTFDIFESCSVKNCEVSYKDEDVDTADIVIAHLHRMKGVSDLPGEDKRKPGQLWAFSSDESQYHTFMSNPSSKMSDYNGKFNWSITYRMDSDVPVPYGRTVIRKEASSKKFNFYAWMLSKKLDVAVAILGSNCGSNNHRWEYVAELKKHINVDMYGGCGTLQCDGHFNKDCPIISNYMFYLSFENSNCDEYITEKVWWNAYKKNSIPVIMGGSKESLHRMLPPHSYIYVEDFATPRDLATYLTYLLNNPSELQIYFQWKKYFEVLNEHGYFQSPSFHYCRICEALNYNDRKSKIYNDLNAYWSVQNNCHPSWSD